MLTCRARRKRVSARCAQSPNSSTTTASPVQQTSTPQPRYVCTLSVSAYVYVSDTSLQRISYNTYAPPSFRSTHAC